MRTTNLSPCFSISSAPSSTTLVSKFAQISTTPTFYLHSQLLTTISSSDPSQTRQWFEEEMHVGNIAFLLMQPDRRLGVIIVFGSSVGVYIYRMKFHLAQIKNRDIVPCTET
ncbi:hypothetical protein ACJW30_03G024000 [Castanea mollissima]